MSDESHSINDRMHWLVKARSRAFVKNRADVADVPLVALTLATFFFAGIFPVASGTVGSLIAAIIYWVTPALHQWFVLSAGIVVVLAIGLWSSAVVERTMKVQDPGIVVIDEVLGQWIALLSISYAGNPVFILIAFLAFRFFDIVKLWPARYFERMHGGAGIMLDDAVAGIYANIVSHLAMYIILMLID
jgi:phosphatidylglycerophosphatase A